jgi:DNA-3-methyladenine glycosylase
VSVRLQRSFFARDVHDVARDLLGCTLHAGGVAVRLTEVEAYAGELDPGSHAYRGPTPRTAVMFGPPGHLYVYFTYGMHWCANVVCGEDGSASAVLLRAGEVVFGEDVVEERRPGVAHRDRARGPARLTRALGITGTLDGVDLCSEDALVWLEEPEDGRPDAVRSGPRVGVRGAGGDAAAYPWRVWIEGEPTVSAYRPAGPRRRRTSR